MKSILVLILSLAGLLPLARAYSGTGVMTLPAPGTSSDNKLQITISINYNGIPVADTRTTTVSGTLNVNLDANPQTGAATQFTINSGNVSMTDMAFNLRAYGILSVATVNTAGMKGTAFTPLPPGVVTPTGTGGTFDAAQHRVLINQGTLTGLITFTDPDTPINANFTEAPVEGPGTGTGTLTVVPGTSTSSHRNCTTTMLLPVDFTQDQDLDGTPVKVTVKGTIKATGVIPIPLNSWIDWTYANDLAGAAFNGTAAPGTAPLGLAWAMGYAPEIPAAAVTPVMLAGAIPSARVVLAAGGSRAPLTLEQSDSLTSGSWQPVPAIAVSGGQNPIPTGASGAITVQWTTPAPQRFLRIQAVQP